MSKKILAGAGLALAAALAFGGTSVAVAASSTSPLPYKVEASGITLLGGDTFRDNGHVNIRYEADGVKLAEGIHFEAKCVERSDAECAGGPHLRAQYIGQSFLPWSVFQYADRGCIEWVQIDLYNEHFGEGGQTPVGPACSTPTATPTATTTPTATATPTPSVTTTSTPEPTATPTQTPEVTPTPESTPPTALEPSPEPSRTLEVTPVPSVSPTAALGAFPSSDREDRDVLPATGVDQNIWISLMLMAFTLAMLGLAIVLFTRWWKSA